MLTARRKNPSSFMGKHLIGKYLVGRCLMMLALLITSTIGIWQVAFAQDSAEDDPNPRVTITTSKGDIVIELNSRLAPVSVENFLAYVDAKFYDGTIFHRVIDQFMVQGGGFTSDYERKPTQAPIRNEANNGLKNERYTLAMARTNAPHSATAQFFINSVDNDFLDHTETTPRGWGYTVFGRVVEGKDVVDEIGQVATAAGGPFSRDAPVEPIIISSVTRLIDPAKLAAEAKSATPEVKTE